MGQAVGVSDRKTRRAHIIIVDDEPALVRTLTRVLSRDYEVTGFGDACEALAYLQGGGDFDVVLCDLMMPKKSGADLYRELSATMPEAAGKFLFVYGGVFTESVQAFLGSVPNLRIEKPFDTTTLREAIANLLRQA